MRYIYLLICSLLFSSINFAQQPIDSTRTDSAQVDSLIFKRNIELQPNIVEPPGGCVISGPTTVTAGQLYTYTVNCSVINPSWSALNGITSNSTPNSVTVKWGLIVNLQSDTTAAPLNDVSTSNTTSNNINFIPPPSTLGQLILKSNGAETGTSLTVYIHEPPTSPFSPGSIAPAQQTVGAGNAAATLNWTSISPGDGTPFTFQWQKSTDSANWTNISGATSMNYSPGVLTAKTYFRAQVGQSSLVDYTNVAVVNINSPLTPGVISPTAQTIAYNTSPGALHCTAATGGTNTYVYQWQSSLNNSTWTNVSGATALTYTPGALTAKTYYRVRIIQGSTTVYTNVSTITVNPPSPTDHVPNVVTALPANQNYIASWTATAPITDPAILITRPLSDVKLTVEYFDGLGRPLQTVVKQGSLVTATLTSADLVSMPLYDGFGRDTGTLLPYPSSTTANGSFRADAQSVQPAWYNSSNSSSPVAGQLESGFNAHSLTFYENSPLNRVLETYAPGGSWVGSSKQPLENNRHGIKQKYLINTVKDSVEMFDVSFPVLGSFGNYTNAGRYEASQLYKNVSVDETGKQVIEFKNQLGQVILKKVQLTATADNGTGSGHA
ncbi:MAG TPA: DUF6443 domain-containing protein, partial [Arachidicoccus sp.]|nr:DUF6443 domain-containing protein [Arachidicoccus sp.]